MTEAKNSYWVWFGKKILTLRHSPPQYMQTTLSRQFSNMLAPVFLTVDQSSLNSRQRGYHQISQFPSQAFAIRKGWKQVSTTQFENIPAVFKWPFCPHAAITSSEIWGKVCDHQLKPIARQNLHTYINLREKYENLGIFPALIFYTHQKFIPPETLFRTFSPLNSRCY